jgi:hypothetical protein
MNSQPMDLAIITKAVVEVGEEAPRKPSRPTASEGDDRLGRRRRLDSSEQRGGLAGGGRQQQRAAVALAGVGQPRQQRRQQHARALPQRKH